VVGPSDPASEEPKEPTGEVTVWHLADRTRVDIPTWENRSTGVTFPLTTPAGAARFLRCSKPGVLQTYEMAGGMPVGSPLELARDPVLRAAFLSPDGERALTTMQDVRIVRGRTPRPRGLGEGLRRDISCGT
jgi:hypothetical protein